MYENLISRLNALSSAWESQFENPPDLPFHWNTDPTTGILTLNDIEVCPAAFITEIDSYGSNWLRFNLQDGYLDIEIDWPYKGQARIAEIVHHRVIT